MKDALTGTGAHALVKWTTIIIFQTLRIMLFSCGTYVPQTPQHLLTFVSLSSPALWVAEATGKRACRLPSLSSHAAERAVRRQQGERKRVTNEGGGGARTHSDGAIVTVCVQAI